MPGALRSVCIVQARRGSTRLPNKVLETLGAMPVLSHVLLRCRAIKGIDAVVCATVNGEDGDAIAELATAVGVLVFRGSETDVLARYHGAAVMADAEVILRVTSDCPLIDPEVCDALLQLRAERNADYAANNMPPSWPHGLDCEAFTAAALDDAAAEAAAPFEREHVTPWIRNNPDFLRVNLPGPGGALVHERWTLDYPEDLAFLRALAAKLAPLTPATGWQVIAETLTQFPELAQINYDRRQR